MRLLLAMIVLITSLPLTAPSRAAAAPAFKPNASPHLSLPEQDPTPTPSPSPSPTATPDLVLEQAQREAKLADELKKKAVSDKERAEAEAARLKALTQPLGAPANITVPTGSVTTDAAGWVESQMLAQEAARQITRRLTQSLCTQPITPGEPSPTIAPAAGGQPGAMPQVTPQKVRTLVIHSPGDLAGVELYGSIYGQLKRLHDELKKKNQEATDFLAKTDPSVAPASGMADVDPVSLALAAPGIATGVIKSVAELINLFRTDTSFTNQAITLNTGTIVSHLVRNFNAGVGSGSNCVGPVRVYHPALYAPRLLESSENSPLLILLNDVETAKVEAAGNIEKLDARVKKLKELGAAFESRDKKVKERAAKQGEKDKKDAAIKKSCNSRRRQGTAECKKLKEESEALGKEIAQLDKGIEELNDTLKNVQADPANFKGWSEKLTDLKAKTQSLVTATDLISAKLNTPDDASKLTALAQLIRAERLHGILKKDGTYTLHIEVKANGTTKVKKNLFVDAKVRHSAGADLTYQLIEGGGVIAQGHELKCYIEYQSARDVQNMVSGAGVKKLTCRFQDDTATPEDERDAERAARRRPSRRTDSGQ
ncbi:MAG: hypothetical protein LC803_21065 [Acidobacteria bacterium]|nr:hypothetical protein [Acidobacteriota bacterium]